VSLPSNSEPVTRVQGWAAVPNWLVRDPDIDPTVKAVYMVLSSYVDRDGTCYPSQEHISELLGTSKRTVQRAIRELRSRGLLEVTTVATAHGRRNTYLLSVHPFRVGG
jgi:biotin operon repressor